MIENSDKLSVDSVESRRIVNEVPSQDRRQHTLDRQHASNVLTSIGECIYEWDIVSDEIAWSEGAQSLLCLDDLSAISSNRRFNHLMLANTVSSRAEVVNTSATVDSGNGAPYRLQYALCGEKIGTGSNIWLEDSGICFADEQGNAVRAQGVVRVINERRSLEERLDRMSRFDPLTGLYNRSHLNTILDDVYNRCMKSGDSAAFLIVGLDHFDLINSAYGYEAGDAVMVEVAKRLKDNLRKVDYIGRYSGAQLGIILEECDEKSLLIAGHRILNLLRNELVETERGPISITAGIGAVLLPQCANSPRDAFNAAHHALQEAKRERESSIAIYEPDPQRDAQQKQAVLMAENIVRALNEGRIHLAYQPVVDATTYEIDFYEALIRLESEDGSVLDAGDFVTIAESLGLIRLVDHHALDLAIETLREYPTARLSLNVSNETASDPEWLSKLAIAALSQPDMPPRLIVEITESHAAESLEEAERFITSLHDLGFKVALDDFGAGFTSFRNLKNLPFDIIKIDGMFAVDLDNQPQNRGFISALVGLARLFEVKTVVEWVEDTGSADTLRDWGVDYLQGFKFGKPTRQPQWQPREITSGQFEEADVPSLNSVA